MESNKLKTRSAIGDVYSVEFRKGMKAYFQYVADDSTQLKSNVIRVFKTRYIITDFPDLKTIVNDSVEFYAHVFLKIGIKLKLWNKVGNEEFNDKLDVLFKDSEDYGNPSIEFSSKWYVWKINEDFEDVSSLHGPYLKAEIGIVIPPDSIVHRITHGKYDFVYPK